MLCAPIDLTYIMMISRISIARQLIHYHWQTLELVVSPLEIGSNISDDAIVLSKLYLKKKNHTMISTCRHRQQNSA